MASLSHIGIAVTDLSRMKLLFSILGMSISHQEDVPEQGVRTHFLPAVPASGGGHDDPLAQLELLEVMDPQGTVAKFIQKRGPGVHHLSFEVNQGELDSTCGKLRSSGFRLVYDAPRIGASGMRMNFVHPATSGGILMELMERV